MDIAIASEFWRSVSDFDVNRGVVLEYLFQAMDNLSKLHVNQDMVSGKYPIVDDLYISWTICDGMIVVKSIGINKGG